MLMTLTACLVGAAMIGTVSRPATGADPDSAAVLATVVAFHAALASGDSAAALDLLAPDAIILEAGELETRTEYAAHHLSADIEFSRAVPSQPIMTVQHHDGAVAWVATTTTTKGTFRGRPIATQGAELMVLSRTEAGWRIRAIHWSSRRL